jgi:hypothetical protein
VLRHLLVEAVHGPLRADTICHAFRVVIAHVDIAAVSDNPVGDDSPGSASEAACFEDVQCDYFCAEMVLRGACCYSVFAMSVICPDEFKW